MTNQTITHDEFINQIKTNIDDDDDPNLAFKNWMNQSHEVEMIDFASKMIWSNVVQKPPKFENVKTTFIRDILNVPELIDTVQLTVFDGKPAKFIVMEGNFTKDGVLNGHCILRILNEIELEKVGYHPMLKWRPHEIIAKFKNGKVNGLLKFEVGVNAIHAFAIEGILHGLVIGYGKTLIYDEEYKVK